MGPCLYHAAKIAFMAMLPVLALGLAVPAAQKPPIKPDKGWARIWQNKSWAYMLDGKQGGILSVLLGPEPLDLRAGARDPASLWVWTQLFKQKGWGGAFKLEVHEPGVWALLKAAGGPPGPIPGKPTRPYLFGVEFRHMADPQKRLAELREGRCDMAEVPLHLVQKAQAIAGVRVATIEPAAGASSLIVAFSNQVRCDCAPVPCFVDLGFVWTLKSKSVK